MKKLFAAITLLALSFAAQAQTVSMTVSVPTADFATWAVMCGQLHNYLDTQTPPQPRSCNATESKAHVNNLILQQYRDWKGTQLNQAALQAVPVPTLSFTTN